MEFVAISSENKELIDAFYKTILKIWNIEEDGWNKSMKIHKDSIYLLVGINEKYRKVCDYHNHNCGTTARKLYILPQDWDTVLSDITTIFSTPIYNGKWKVGDVLFAENINSSQTMILRESGWVNSQGFFNGDRSLENIGFRESKWVGLISGTCDVWVDLESIPDEKTLILQKAILDSKLKIGDKNKFSRKTFAWRGWGEAREWSDTFADGDEYTLLKFEYFKDTPCAVIEDTDKELYYFPLGQFATQSIGIEEYDSKIENDTVSFGCQTFTKDEVKAYKRLFKIPKTVILQIGKTNITEGILDSLLEQFDK